MRSAILGIQLALVALAACSSEAPTTSAVTTRQSFGGTGDGLGGCPVVEPGEGEPCSTPGRACLWTRSCGGGPTERASSTGWCTKGGRWRIAVQACEPGCPEAPATYMPSQFATTEPDQCAAGTVCHYPSTPFESGKACKCLPRAGGGGTWNRLCNEWDDGWKGASQGPSAATCGELVACSAGSGCFGACSSVAVKQGPGGSDATAPPASPSQTTFTCGCSDEGVFVCRVKSCGESG